MDEEKVTVKPMTPEERDAFDEKLANMSDTDKSKMAGFDAFVSEEIEKNEEEAQTDTAAEEAPESTETAVPAPEPAPEKAKKTGKKFNSKKFRHGALSIVFTVIFIAAVVLINVIVGLVLDRFNVEADLTDGAIFSLGDETVSYIRGVNDDVHFYVTADRDTLNNAGAQYKQTVEFLEKMASLNGRFSVEYINLLTDPDFSNEFVEDLRSNQVIVRSGNTGRYRILGINDFMRYTLDDGKSYTYDQANMYVTYYGYSVMDYSSQAEPELVSAIMNVSLEDPTVVTFLNGYGEPDSSALRTILTDNAYIVQDSDIERIAAVPEETDILVIYGPTKDYSIDSVNKIDEWLSNGGKFGKNLVYIATPEPVPTPNLDELLKEWGLEVGKGYILQADSNYTYSSTPFMQDL
ncbi:MAG: GldG family protein [Ruminiclostridium sp.]|nr:GldG family protein [Ruminiclostridium sp.]